MFFIKTSLLLVEGNAFFYGAKAHREIWIFREILATTTQTTIEKHSAADVRE